MKCLLNFFFFFFSPGARLEPVIWGPPGDGTQGAANERKQEGEDKNGRSGTNALEGESQDFKCGKMKKKKKNKKKNLLPCPF